MANRGKDARFYQVSKRDGNDETWQYLVPGQNELQVRIDAEQEYVRTDIKFYGWHPVTVDVGPDGVFFSTLINGQEWNYSQGQEGYSYLTTYLGPEYSDANRSYFS